MQPDLLLHECSPAFPEAEMRQVLNDRVDEQMRCIFARHYDDESHEPHERSESDEEAQTYVLASMVLSPVDLGVPASRPRRYTVALYRAAATFTPTFTEYSQLYGASLLCDVRIYYAVGLSALEEDGRSAAGFGELCAGDANGLESYQATSQLSLKLKTLNVSLVSLNFRTTAKVSGRRRGKDGAPQIREDGFLE